MKEWRKHASCKIYSIHSGIAIHVWDTYTTAASENYKLNVSVLMVTYYKYMHMYIK